LYTCPALNVHAKISPQTYASHSPAIGVASACRDFSMGVTLAGGWLSGWRKGAEDLTHVVGLALPGRLTAYKTIDHLLGCAPCWPTSGVTT
jgi:hypothetical protein